MFEYCVSIVMAVVFLIICVYVIYKIFYIGKNMTTKKNNDVDDETMKKLLHVARHKSIIDDMK